MNWSFLKRRTWQICTATVVMVCMVALCWPAKKQESIRSSNGAVTKKHQNPAESYGKPVLAVSPTGQLQRISHVDANGLTPLEIISHPSGDIRIQRTFDMHGKVIKEEASRGGLPVPLPGK